MQELMEKSKVIVVPGTCDTLGGTLVTLSLLIEGFYSLNKADSLVILVRAGSVMEQYLQEANQCDVLHIISATSKADFLKHAFRWVNQQPNHWSLLLDNCIERSLLSSLAQAAPRLRLSGRPIYHFCHDLALSRNPLGYWSRKLAFKLLAPKGLCNSNFTAQHVSQFIPNIQGVLYQPVNTARFNPKATVKMPLGLESIVASGAKVMLTPSRINQAGIINDKNLRALVSVVAELKALGHFYHGVIVGEDRSLGKTYTQELLELAAQAGVADRFTILPPTFDVVSYYRFADVVVTLAPREPFGRTVVEAIACGVPVVGASSGGIGEILHHFAPDWCVDPASISETAQKIVHVVEDPQTYYTLDQGRHWVEAHCSITQYARDMIKLIELEEQTVEYTQPKFA